MQHPLYNSSFDDLLTDLSSDVFNDPSQTLLLEKDTYIQSVLNTAESLKLFDRRGNQSITLFLPVDEHSFTTNTRFQFEYCWNRHTFPQKLMLPSEHSVVQLKTLMNITYAVYQFQGKTFIGTSEILLYDADYDTNVSICLIHDVLVNLRVSNISSFACVMVGRQEEEIYIQFDTFKTCELDRMTLHYELHRSSDRTIIGNGRVVCDLSDQKLDVTIPMIQSKQEVNFWLHLTMDAMNIPIASWLRPHTMMLFPSVHKECNVCIGDFTPQRVQKNQALWIDGSGFSLLYTKVSLSGQNAVVYTCTPTLIKCIVPDCGTEQKELLLEVSNRDFCVTSRNVLLYTGRSVNCTKRKAGDA